MEFSTNQAHCTWDPGRRIRAAFRLVLVTALVASSPLACLQRQRPNVLLVTIDTLRADHVGCYGDSEARTPNLDRLAREGVAFDHASTAVPLTLPSHTTLLTGCYPLHHGVRNNGTYDLPSDVPTLAEHFHDAGYRTGAFVSAFVLNRQFGLSRGFDVYDDSLLTERRGSETVRRAIAWLDRRDRRPFFVWVHLYEPHAPWTPPMPYAALPLPSGYDREIAAADGALGALLDHLRSTGRLDRTIVDVMADHGEGLNDHGEMEHGVFLYQETIRIPWLLRLPHGRDAGRRVPSLVATIDLAPTLCELAGLPPMAGIDGFSLVPTLNGGALPPRSGIYLETVYPKENFGWAPLSGLAGLRWKWIRGPAPELYRLTDDSAERNNLRSSQPDTATLLSQRLIRVEQGIQHAETGQPRNVSAEVVERLRSLGYLSAGTQLSESSDSLPDPKRMIGTLNDFEDAKRAFDDRRYADAVPILRRVLSQNERNLVALQDYGSALNDIAEFKDAEQACRRAVEISPNNTPAITGLADAVFGEERWGEALDLYRLAAPSAYRARQVNSRIAICLAQTGQPAAADQALVDAVQRYPADQRFYTGVGAQIHDYLALAGDAAPPDSVALRHGMLACNLGLYAESERWLSRSLATRALDRQRLDFLEQLYTQVQRFPQALATLRQEAKNIGWTGDLEWRQADLLTRSGKLAEALSALEALPDSELAQEGIRAQASYDRAGLLCRLGRRDEGIDALDQAIRAGYADLGHLLNDVNLAGVRDDPRYLTLVDGLSKKGWSGTRP